MEYYRDRERKRKASEEMIVQRFGNKLILSHASKEEIKALYAGMTVTVEFPMEQPKPAVSSEPFPYEDLGDVYSDLRDEDRRKQEGAG